MQSGEIVAGRFEILSLAGSGGMGAVYTARDRQTGQTVALKVLHGHSGAHAERFAREAQLLSELRHPGIVRFVGSGVAAHGDGFIVMEWLEGQSLAAYLERGPLTIADAVQLGARVADALRPAHERGIVHRDLKPQNLFLEGGVVDRVKVLDFGIARLLEPGQKLTVTGQMIGTPGYMSPEQIRGAAGVDARTDVYALGCVLYCALTQRPPFAGDSPVASLVQVIRDEAPRVSRTRPDAPPALDDLIARMLSIAPERRPDNAAAVLAELAVIGGFQAGATAIHSPASPRAVGPAGHFAAMAPSSFTQSPPPAPRLAGTPAQAGARAGAARSAGGNLGGNAGANLGPPAPPSWSTTVPVVHPTTAVSPMGQGGYPPASGGPFGGGPGSAPGPVGYAPGPPFPGAPIQEPPAAGGRATVLVLLGAVGALLLVLVMVCGAIVFWLLRPAPPPGAPASTTDTTAYCPGERCLPIRVTDPAHVDAVALLPEARRMAREVEPTAELVMLMVSTPSADGTIDTGNPRQLLNYHFQDAQRDVRFFLWVNGERLVLTRADVVPSQLPLKDPGCPIGSVLRIAGAGGAGNRTVTLTNSGPPLGPIFMVASSSANGFVEPERCTVKRF